ncbi:MAG: hypothetical protein IT385_14655 [Deltaproteobacteria bacterium]|nr:hypothetical protein [Deltaproteobacteria bacterium]
MRATALRVLLGFVLFLPWAACGDGDGASDTARDVPTDTLVDTLVDASTETASDTTPPIDVPPGSLLLSGSVQKGPFVVGSSVVVAPLDAELRPTGQSFTTQTTNDRGEFQVVFEASGPVAVEGVGYYYNEITGALSGSELTLRAFFVPVGTGPQEARLNLVTHLTTERIKALVAGGATFGAAVAQAEGELFAALDLCRDGFTPSKAGIGLDVLGGDDDDNAWLLTLSAVLLETADARPAGSLEAKIQELLNQMALDLADGTLTPALDVEITRALLALDADFVEARLAERFAQIGSSATVPDMDRVVDQDRDGLANLADNCPVMANAGQDNADGDRFGTACDDCPGTACDGLCLVGDGGSESCFAICTTDGDCAGGTCLSVASQAGELRFCGGACAPLGPSCASEDRCAFAFGVDEAFHWACVPAALVGAADVGDACESHARACADPSCAPRVSDCATGTLCACAPDAACPPGSFFACRRLCDPGAPAGACDPESCDDVGAGLGLCALPSGQAGDPCTTEPDTCGPGLMCVVANPALCPGLDHADGGCCVGAGGDGEPCLEDNTCDEGLACTHQPPPGYSCDPACCVPAGGEGQPCLPERVCGTGLVCSQLIGLTDACDGGADCCIPAGGAGEPCLADGTCDPGMGCISDMSCSGSSGMSLQCCVAAADTYEACDPTTPCGAGDVCASAGARCTSGPPCCIPVPGVGDDCYFEQVCDEGLRCQADDACDSGACCVETGTALGPCAPPSGGDTPRCDEGFACVDELCMPYDGTCSLSSQVCAAPDTYCKPADLVDSQHGACLVKGDEGDACQASWFDRPCRQGLTCLAFAVDPPCESPVPCSAGCPISCCVAPFGPGEACFGRPDLCEAGLACVHTGVDGLCAQGVDYCCLVPGETGARCVGGSCEAGAACFRDWCVPSSGACPGNTCPNAALEVCVGGTCLSWGGSNEPCGPGEACDAPLGCVSDRCTATGGDGEPCNPGGTCDTGDLACNGTLCVPAGGESELCRATATPCDAGLVCVNQAGSVCAGVAGNRCCHSSGAVGEPCNVDGSCDAVTSVCKTSASLSWSLECVLGQGPLAPCDTDHPCQGDHFCAPGDAVCGPGVTCCQARRPVGGPCDGDGGRCLPGLACASQNLMPCPDGLAYCCVEAGAQDEACRYPDNACDAGLGCLLGRCRPGGDVGQPCVGGVCDTGACLQGMCRDTSGACGIGGSCPPGRSCQDGQCLARGGVWEACNPGDSCDAADLRCVTSGVGGACPWAVSMCCVPAGGEGEVCLAGDACASADLACAMVNPLCDIDDQKCCVPAVGAWQPCPNGLPCADGWCVSHPDCPGGIDGGGCCVQPLPQGADCLGMGICQGGLQCVWSQSRPCPGDQTFCCEPVGGLGELCDNGACRDGNTCSWTGGTCPAGYVNCCVLP